MSEHQISGLLRVMLLLVILVGASAALINCGPPPILNEGSQTDGGGVTTEIAPAPDKATPTDTPTGQACKSICDCQQGTTCTDGKCMTTATKPPEYCCEKLGCPAGQACVSIKGGKAVCGAAGAACNSACDCVPGLGCINGQCTKLTNPVYCCENTKECPAGAACETKAGVQQTCPSVGPRTCQTFCDCEQGETCEKGQCLRGRTPVYCCAKAGCPDGAACYKADGNPGVCGQTGQCSTNADCDNQPKCRQSGSTCYDEVEACVNGQCIKQSAAIAGGQCLPPGDTCTKPKVCRVHCDCPSSQGCINGKCETVQGRSYICCTDPQCAPGTVCYKPDDSVATCGGSTSGCKSDADCPAGSCQDVGTSCEETKFACDTQSGKCVPNRFRLQNSLCEQNQGRCLPAAASCQVACDCPQGQGCVNGRCSASTKAYCCGRAGCPAGQACTDTSGNVSTCKSAASCQSNADCGNAYCTQQGNDCLPTKPVCMNGQCQSSAIIEKGAVCDAATGTCKPGCRSDASCQKATCKQSGRLCERTLGRCVNGQCQVGTSAEVGTCDSATGICKPPTTCQQVCDCPQGSYCYQGQCIRSSFPAYCCDNPGCPAGATCYANGTQAPGTCPTLCKSPCDCPEGQDCVSGKCAAGPSPVYCCTDAQKCPVGETCGDANGNKSTCPNKPRTCQIACDCVQGEDCINGQCQKGTKAVYCCEKEGCPVNAGCVSKSQLSGTCPQSCTSHCDCPQGSNCVNGKCNNNPAISGQVFCCDNPGCPTGQICYARNGQPSRCAQKQCQSACDCSQGEDCRNGRCFPTQPPVYCCSKNNCPSGQACRNANNTWGTCKATTTCKVACDCPQGQDCFNGQCVSVFPAVYCCKKTGCPSGQACLDETGKQNFCPVSACKTACDCSVQGQSCVNGRCVYLTGAARIYCCNKPFCPAGNKCEDNQGNQKLCSKNSCTTPCDCNLGEDCRGGVCTNVSPPVYCCSASVCPSQNACVKSDGTRGVCP